MLGTIILVLIIIVLFKFLKNNKIKWNTFIQKGIRIVRGRFGVYIYDGKQGTGRSSDIFSKINPKAPAVFPVPCFPS